MKHRQLLGDDFPGPGADCPDDPVSIGLHDIITPRVILAHVVAIHNEEVAIFTAHDCQVRMRSDLIRKEYGTTRAQVLVSRLRYR